jgi:hypothetical protein
LHRDISAVPLDEFAETGLRAIGSVFRWIAWDLFIDILCFQVGRFALLVLTLGRYPREKDLERHHGRISVAGMFTLVAIWSCIAIANNLT